MHQPSTEFLGEVAARSPEEERTLFMEQAGVVPAPMELYAIWVDTYRSQQDSGTVSKHTSREHLIMESLKDISPSSPKYLMRLSVGRMTKRYSHLNISLPTQGEFGTQIPDLQGLCALYMPDIITLDHLAENPVEALEAARFLPDLKKPKDFVHTTLLTLALDSAGYNLVAMSNIHTLGRISPEVFEFMGSRQFKKSRQNLINLLRNARYTNFSPRPNLTRIPGIDTSGLDTDKLLFRDPDYPGETNGFYHANRHLDTLPGKVKRFEGDVVDRLRQAGFTMQKPDQNVEAENETVPTLEVLPPKRDHEHEAYGACEVAWDHNLKTAAHAVADAFVYGVDFTTSPEVLLPNNVIKEIKALATLLVDDVRYRYFSIELSSFATLADQIRIELPDTIDLRCVSVYDPETPDIVFPAHGSGNDEHFYDTDGLLHQDDGPAVLLQDGTRIWYKNGQPHRDIGYAKYFPPFSTYNNTSEARFEFWQNGKLYHQNPDHPTIWGKNGDRIWGDSASPKRQRVDMPVSVLGDKIVYKTGDTVTKIIEPRLPETPTAFLASLRGRRGFLKLTLQEVIDLDRWEKRPKEAAARAKALNTLGRQATKNS